MKRALRSKHKLNFVDGNISKPSNYYPNFDVWERCNIMFLSWITRTLTPQMVESVIYIDVTKHLWKDLKEKFSKEIIFESLICFKRFTLLNKVK